MENIVNVNVSDFKALQESQMKADINSVNFHNFISSSKKSERQAS